MLPDFSGLRQQSCDRADLRSLEHLSDNGFGQTQSSQQSFQKCDGEAFQGNRTLDLIPKRDLDQAFYQLWLAHPSWSPILLTPNGWKTAKGSGKKKVPLTFGTIESYYRRGVVLGKRFGQLTNYLMIDIDINSPFHPRSGGIQAILSAMERIGLCRYLIVRSSASGGLHLYFPLPEPVNAWALASTAHSALTNDGIRVTGGQCELFPNKKAFNAEHHGHRLPLQNGSFLLDKDFSPISQCRADFVVCWETAAAHQDEVKLQQALASNDSIVALRPSPTQHDLPPIAWTHYGQSNDIMRELVNYGDRYAGHKTIDELAAWVKAVAPQLPGYEKFASPKSKQDIEQGNWPTRWSKSHFESAWQYSSSGPDHNANKARDARMRIFAALERLCIAADIGITMLWKQISAISTSCFNKGIAWKTFKKYEDEVLACVIKTDKLGPSRGLSEDVNPFSPELTKTEKAEPEILEKKPPAQLLTLRCVISIYSSAFGSFATPKTRPSQGGCSTAKTSSELPAGSVEATNPQTDPAGDRTQTDKVQAEDSERTKSAPKGFTVGQAVRIVMPGGSLDGIETRIQAQILNVLGQPVYQLDYQRQGQVISLPAECLQVMQPVARALPGEATIRATAAQLLQVLGQACPFVGPGLWTVRREEVSPLAWRQLLRLVEDG